MSKAGIFTYIPTLTYVVKKLPQLHPSCLAFPSGLNPHCLLLSHYRFLQRTEEVRFSPLSLWNSNEYQCLLPPFLAWLSIIFAGIFCCWLHPSLLIFMSPGDKVIQILETQMFSFKVLLIWEAYFSPNTLPSISYSIIKIYHGMKNSLKYKEISFIKHVQVRSNAEIYTT